MSTVQPAYSIFAPKKPNRGILKVRIKFTDTGNVYDVVLVEKDTAMSLVDSSGSNFLAISGMIIVDEATIEKIKAIIGELIDSGFFDHLVPVE
jgi:hypothetical protein